MTAPRYSQCSVISEKFPELQLISIVWGSEANGGQPGGRGHLEQRVKECHPDNCPYVVQHLSQDQRRAGKYYRPQLFRESVIFMGAIVTHPRSRDNKKLSITALIAHFAAYCVAPTSSRRGRTSSDPCPVQHVLGLPDQLLPPVWVQVTQDQYRDVLGQHIWGRKWTFFRWIVIKGFKNIYMMLWFVSDILKWNVLFEMW